MLWYERGCQTLQANPLWVSVDQVALITLHLDGADRKPQWGLVGVATCI